MSGEHADGTKPEQELVMVRKEIAERQNALERVMTGFAKATDATDKQFYADARKDVAADLDKLRDIEMELVRRLTAPP